MEHCCLRACFQTDHETSSGCDQVSVSDDHTFALDENFSLYSLVKASHERRHFRGVCTVDLVAGLGWVLLSQRHGVRARPRSRLRSLGERGSGGLELRRLSSLLPQIANTRDGRERIQGREWSSVRQQVCALALVCVCVCVCVCVILQTVCKVGSLREQRAICTKNTHFSRTSFHRSTNISGASLRLFTYACKCGPEMIDSTKTLDISEAL